MSITLKVKRLSEKAKLPNYAYPGDVGLDLYAIEDHVLKSGERRVFPLGFALEFPHGFAAIVKDKGSLPKNAGIHTMGGVFDAGYRGEYNVQLINLGQDSYEIKEGNKIAQLIIFPVETPKLEEVEELSSTERGGSRFGSSGK